MEVDNNGSMTSPDPFQLKCLEDAMDMDVDEDNDQSAGMDLDQGQEQNTLVFRAEVVQGNERSKENVTSVSKEEQQVSNESKGEGGNAGDKNREEPAGQNGTCGPIMNVGTEVGTHAGIDIDDELDYGEDSEGAQDEVQLTQPSQTSFSSSSSSSSSSDDSSDSASSLSSISSSSLHSEQEQETNQAEASKEGDCEDLSKAGKGNLEDLSEEEDRKSLKESETSEKDDREDGNEAETFAAEDRKNLNKEAEAYKEKAREDLNETAACPLEDRDVEVLKGGGSLPAAPDPDLEISKDPNRHEFYCRYTDFLMHKANWMTQEALIDTFYEDELPLCKVIKKTSRNITFKGYTFEQTKRKVAEKKRKATPKLREKIKRKTESPGVVYYMKKVWEAYDTQLSLYKAQCRCPNARVGKDEAGELMDTFPPPPLLVPVTELRVPPLRISIPAPASAAKRKLTQAENAIVSELGVDLSESDSDDESSSA